jgi:hypothetical protein
MVSAKNVGWAPNIHLLWWPHEHWSQKELFFIPIFCFDNTLFIYLYIWKLMTQFRIPF